MVAGIGAVAEVLGNAVLAVLVTIAVFIVPWLAAKGRFDRDR